MAGFGVALARVRVIIGMVTVTRTDKVEDGVSAREKLTTLIGNSQLLVR